MAEIIDFPKAEQIQKPWEWLRRMADSLEKEGEETEVLMTLVVVNNDTDVYRLRSQRYGATRLEAVGMLTSAAHDFNAGDLN